MLCLYGTVTERFRHVLVAGTFVVVTAIEVWWYGLGLVWDCDELTVTCGDLCRAVQKKDCEELMARLKPQLPHCSWSCSEAKLGYSGTAILSKVRRRT